ncbi:hypothetical protein AB0H12_36960 [Actinosynnema sp. NPDC023794]
MDRLLDPLRDEDPLPPSEVDIDRAIRVGRGRVRTWWVGTGVLVAAVAFLVPVLGPPGGSGSSVDPATSSQRAAEPRDFDPLRRVVAVADVPGIVIDSYTTARRWQRISVRDAGWTGLGSVTVHAPGRQAADAEGGVLRPETGTPTEPVDGRPAYWVDRPSGDLLAWQWTDGAWAFVRYQDVRTEDEADRDTARRIALAVRVGAGEPVTMPFTVPRRTSWSAPPRTCAHPATRSCAPGSSSPPRTPPTRVSASTASRSPSRTATGWPCGTG